MAIHHQPGGGGFSTEPREGVMFCWDIRGNYATKSTVAECFFFFFFFIQFNVPFKIISLIETSQSIGGRNGRTPGKPPDTPASRTWLVSRC